MLIVSSACDAHTADIHVACTLFHYVLLKSHLLTEAIAVYTLYKIAPSIIFDSCYSALFSSVILMRKKETLYANFLPFPSRMKAPQEQGLCVI